MSLASRLPRGATLTDASFEARHRIVQGFVWLNVPVLALIGFVFSGEPALHVAAIMAAIVGLAVAGRVVASAGLRADVTSMALMGCSYAAIHFSGGRLDSHFHLFVSLVFVALYQRWTALLTAIVTVVLHHAVLGLLAPEHVFGMVGVAHAGHGGGAALTTVLPLVGLHAGFVVIEVVAILTWWHFAEQSEREVHAALQANADARAAATEAAAAVEADARAAEHARAARLSALIDSISAQADRISRQAMSAAEAVAQMDGQMTVLTHGAHAVAEQAGRAASAAEEGRGVAATAQQQVTQLEVAAKEIAEVNTLITEIAGQTNLLALNATIEAARAGEAGKGFAVVSAEVKDLARETTSSASSIADLVTRVQAGTDQVSESIRATGAAISAITSVQDQISQAVAEQVAAAGVVSARLDEAAEAAREIAAGVDALRDSAHGALTDVGA